MYLLQKGANLEIKDMYGNTPLSTALLYQKQHFAAILIKEGADVNVMIEEESQKRAKKLWKQMLGEEEVKVEIKEE